MKVKIGLAAFGAMALLGGPALSEAAAQETRPGTVVMGRAAQQGWLGIMFQRNESAPRVVVVSEVAANSPARRAGVQPGDTIVRLNGRAVTQDQIRGLQLAPGDTVRLQVRRQGRAQDVAVVAARRPAMGEIMVRPGADGRRVVIVDGDTVRVPVRELTARMDTVMRRMRVFMADSLPQHLRELEGRIPEVRMRVEGDTVIDARVRVRDGVLRPVRPGDTVVLDVGAGARAVAGAEFTELNPALAQYFRGATEGLLVTRVAPETPAARAGLQPGDVIIRANGQPVRTVPELRRAVAQAGREEVRLNAVRQGRQQELRISPRP